MLQIDKREVEIENEKEEIVRVVSVLRKEY